MQLNRIKSIDGNSPLKGKVNIGDRLVSINGNEIHDVLDYKFFAYDRKLSIAMCTTEGRSYTIKIKKPEGGDLGIDFESYLMDSPRSCANNCIFCFIDQLPKGMRKTMYFKDDDARLSFLLGNYITLTNLSEREVQRIIDLHISPVNVSVHTTNPELRCTMLRNPNAGRGLDIMKRFAEAGIIMNCQIVCCPGINDGDELLRSMKDLSAMYPAVNSVSIVPVGLTKYREGLFELQLFTAEHAAETIALVTEYGNRCLAERGSRIFFCGDELYLKAGLEIPADEFYENYTQLENGVGMLRLLETEFMSALKLPDRPTAPRNFSIACGTSVAPFFQKLVCNAHERYDIITGNVYPIVNNFFGNGVNVSGLITGKDLISQLKGKELGDALLISQNMLRRAEMDFLDDVTLEQASEELGVPIIPVEQDGFALLDAMLGQENSPCPANDGMGNEEFYVYNR